MNATKELKIIKELLNNKVPSGNMQTFNKFSEYLFGSFWGMNEAYQVEMLEKKVSKGKILETEITEFIKKLEITSNRILHKFGRSENEIERLKLFLENNNCGKTWLSNEDDFDINPETGLVTCVYEY